MLHTQHSLQGAQCGTAHVFSFVLVLIVHVCVCVCTHTHIMKPQVLNNKTYFTLCVVLEMET